MNNNGPIRDEFLPEGFGSGGSGVGKSGVSEKAHSSSKNHPFQQKGKVARGQFPTFEKAGVLKEQENTANQEHQDTESKVEDLKLPEEEFEQEALSRSAEFTNARDVESSLEKSSAFREMEQLIKRRESILTKITTTQTEIVSVQAKVKRLTQELQDAEAIKEQSLALAKDEAGQLDGEIASSVEEVFNIKKDTIEAQKENLLAQFNVLQTQYKEQKTVFLGTEASINTIRQELRDTLTLAISHIETKTNFTASKEVFGSISSRFEELQEKAGLIEKTITKYEALKEVDPKSKAKWKEKIAEKKTELKEVQNELKEVEKALKKSENALAKITKRTKAIENIQNKKGLQIEADLTSSEASFEDFSFEIQDKKEEASVTQESGSGTNQKKKASSKKTSSPNPNSNIGSSYSVRSSTGESSGIGGGVQRQEAPRRPVAKKKHWLKKLFSFWN